MNNADVSVYRELADLYQQQGQSQLRDRFLLLAALAAHESGNSSEADRLRQRLLQYNPHHLVKPFSSFADAMRSPDVQTYVRDLKQSYPPETAQQMLAGFRQAGQDPASQTPYRLLPPQVPPRVPISAPAMGRPAPPAPRTLRTFAPAAPQTDDAVHGTWFATLLFVVTLLVGAGLAAYTLVRPFLQ
jgi:hypothetical protein